MDASTILRQMHAILVGKSFVLKVHQELKNIPLFLKHNLWDYVAQVEHVNGIYNSQHADVDAMVAKDHTHANLEVLNGLTEEKIAKLAKKQDNTIIKYGENADKLENKEGDIVYNVTGVIN